MSGEVVSLFKPLVSMPGFLLLTVFAKYLPPEAAAKILAPILNFDFFWYAALSGVLAALLWIFLYRALKMAEAAYVSILGTATPVLVAFMAILFFDEKISTVQMLGGLIILVAGLLTHLQSLR